MPAPSSTLALVAVSLALALPEAAAQKREREFSIEAAEAPAAVRHYIDSAYADARRVRYYRQVSEDGAAIEAKFKLAGTQYSVEFEEGGVWQDTEVEVPTGNVPAVVWDAEACPLWTDTFELYRVVRVQDHVDRAGDRYFEVELRARLDREWDAYQYQIAPDGRVLSGEVIELSPGHLSRW